MMQKNSLRLYIYTILLSIMTSSISYAQITATASINSITVNKIVAQVESDTLVLINIDNTILTPKSKMFRYTNNPYINFVDDLSALALTNSSVNEIIAQLILQRQMTLVEKTWPDFINKLKAKGALVFGFVKTEDPYRVIRDFEAWQYNQLQEFNIQFTGQINDKEIFKFDDKDPNTAEFYKGVIYTNFSNKTQTLIKFLDITKLKPLKIIVFENRKIELERIDSFLRTVDIEYYGIEYLAAKEISGSPDTKIAKLQQDTLLKTGKWLEDEQAESLLSPNQSSPLE